MAGRNSSFLLLIIAMLLWGSLYPVSKHIMTEINPLTMAFLRYFTGTLTLLVFFIIEIRKNSRHIKRKDLLSISLLGIPGVTVFALFLFYGISLSTASNGSIIANSQAVFTVFLAPVLIRETANIFQIAGSAAGLFGVILVITSGIPAFPAGAGGIFIGNLLLAAAAFSMSVYSILLKSYIKSYGGVVTTFISMASGTLLLFIINLFSRNFFPDLLKLNSPADIALIIYLGSFATAFSYLMFNISLKHIDVVRATGFKFLIPVSGFILSVLFLGERPSAAVFAGTGIVILSIILMQRSPVRSLD